MSNRPKLIALVFRSKTGCRQYAFGNIEDLRLWTKRHPYKHETVRVMPINLKGDIAGDKWMHASQVMDFMNETIKPENE